MILTHTDGTIEKVDIYAVQNGVRLRAVTIESEDFRAFLKDESQLGKCFFAHVMENFLVRLVP